jgi:hypothetical protein
MAKLTADQHWASRLPSRISKTSTQDCRENGAIDEWTTPHEGVKETPLESEDGPSLEEDAQPRDADAVAPSQSDSVTFAFDEIERAGGVSDG